LAEFQKTRYKKELDKTWIDLVQDLSDSYYSQIVTIRSTNVNQGQKTTLDNKNDFAFCGYEVSKGGFSCVTEVTSTVLSLMSMIILSLHRGQLISICEPSFAFSSL